MPDELPTVRARSDLDDLARLGQWLAWSESGKDDERSRGASAALRLYYARELGLTPMAAASLSVIAGKLVIGADLARALARRSGYRVRRIQSDDQVCIADIVVIQTGEILGDATFTIEDARRAGLIRDRSAWKTHPARMLWARASVYAIKDHTPEVLLGIVLDDEQREIEQAQTTDVPWDDEPLEAEASEPDDQPDDDPAGADVDDIEF